MMKRVMFGLLALVVGAGCAPEPSATPPASQFVPAERAYQGAACETIGRTAGVCAREGDFCAQGGYRPARYECIFNTWRCTVDTTRSCPTPTDPMECIGNIGLGACSYPLRCPDGSAVPAAYSCIGGRRVCLPVDDCPRAQSDAGVVSDSNIPDGSAPTDSMPVSPPSAELHVEPIEMVADLATDGSEQGFIGVHFFSTGGMVRLKSYRFSVIPSGRTNDDPPVDWSVQNLAVRGNADVPGMRVYIAHDPASSPTPTRITVTLVYDRAIQIDGDGVYATLVGRVNGRPQSGDRLSSSFTFGEGRYTYAASTIGTLTPVTYYTVPGGVPSGGPHLYYGTGVCETFIPAAYMMPGNMTSGIVLWAPETADFNEFDCRDARALRTWRNTIAPPPSMTGAPPSNTFGNTYVAR